jgi:hypothetical protein
MAGPDEIGAKTASLQVNHRVPAGVNHEKTRRVTDGFAVLHDFGSVRVQLADARG